MTFSDNIKEDGDVLHFPESPLGLYCFLECRAAYCYETFEYVINGVAQNNTENKNVNKILFELVGNF